MVLDTLGITAIGFNRLRGTREEGEQIAALLGVEPWLAEQALEKRLKECRSPRILHLATPGFFLADQERDPNKDARGLGAPGWQSDGGLAAPGMENPLLRSGLALIRGELEAQRLHAAA